MSLISKDEIRNLVNQHPDICVSLYLPTFRTGLEVRQNSIRFKDLLRRAETRLSESGLRGNEQEKILEPARRLLEDEIFWMQQRDGLVVFLSRNGMKFHCLPLRFEETLEVGTSYYLKPLLPLLGDNVEYYLLALDQKKVRLFLCDRFAISEIELKGFPTGIDEALKYDDFERQPKLQVKSPRAGSERVSIFHGHGTGASSQHKNEILRFFQQVDRGIQRYINGGNTPLVLCGPEFLLPIYHKANSYSHIVVKGVDKDPQWISDEELHGLSLEAMDDLFKRDLQNATDKFHRLLNSGLASAEMEHVVPAAYQGRVEYLFVDTTHQERGAFDTQTQQVSRDNKDKFNSFDLLDFAAVHTVLREGTVFGMETAGLQVNKPIAAVYRY